MKLHPVRHDYKSGLWCGIAALSAISGRRTSECRLAILDTRSNRGVDNRTVMGLHNWEVLGALFALGFNAVNVGRFVGPMRERPTLARFLRERHPNIRRAVLLLELTGHYVTVSARKFVDNHQPEIANIRDSGYRRSRVKNAWFIMRRPT